MVTPSKEDLETVFHLSLLGPFELQQENGTIVNDFVSDKVRALLAYLAVEAERSHRRDTLAALLWSEMSDFRARRNLSQALYNLRKIMAPLAAELFDVTAKTIRLLPQNQLEVDVRLLKSSLQLVKNHPHPHGLLCPHCRTQLAEAVGYYRGEFLGAINLSASPPFEEWLFIHRESVQREMIEALKRLAVDSSKRGKSNEAVTYLRQILGIDNLYEEAYRQLIALLAIIGRRNEALSQYEQFREILWQELQAEPDEATLALANRLRSEDAIPEWQLFGRDQQPTSDQSSSVAAPWTLAQTLETAAQVARNQDDYTSALEHLQTALELYRDVDDQPGIARVLTLLGLTQRDRGAYQRAETLIYEACQIYLGLGDRLSASHAKIARARLLTFAGDFDEVISLLEEALPIYHQLDMQREVAYFTVGLALHEMLLGRYDVAHTHAQRAIQLGHALQERGTINFAMSVLGMIAIGRRDYAAGEQLLKQALVLARVMRRPEELSGSLAGLGYILLQKGDTERAKQHIRDGLQWALNRHSFGSAMFVMPAAAYLLKVLDAGELATKAYLSSAGFEFFRQSPHLMQLYTPFFGALHFQAHSSIQNKKDVAALWRCLQKVTALLSP